MYKFMMKHDVTIGVALAVCLFMFLAVVLIVPELKPIDDQVATLYSQAEAIEEDFSSVREMSNVTISFFESKIKVTLKEKFCTLNITYSKDGTIIAKQLEDSRLCDTLPGLISGIVLLLFLSAMLSFIFVYVVEYICKKRYNCKKHKEQANANNEQNKSM